MVKPVRHRDRWRGRPFDADGARLSQVFNSFAECEDWIRDVEQEAAEVRRGLRAKSPPKRTLNDLCDYWLEHRAAAKVSPKDDESIIRAHLRPAFGPMLLKDLAVEEIDLFKRSKVQPGPGRNPLGQKTLHNILTLLISMMNLAVELAWLPKRPVIRKPRLEEDDFTFLSDVRMITALLECARERSEHAFVLYAAAFYTGMREGELAGLQWDDVHLERRLITVCRSFENPTKNKRIRRVPILDPLLPLLRSWRLKTSGSLVFPNAAGKMHQPSARIFQEQFQRVQASAVERLRQQNAELAATWKRIVFHDTRHTFASHWMMDGGNVFRLQKILGHASIQTTMRYAHLAPAVFAEDHGRLGDFLPSEPASVLELRR